MSGTTMQLNYSRCKAVTWANQRTHTHVASCDRLLMAETNAGQIGEMNNSPPTERTMSGGYVFPMCQS